MEFGQRRLSTNKLLLTFYQSVAWDDSAKAAAQAAKQQADALNKKRPRASEVDPLDPTGMYVVGSSIGCGGGCMAPIFMGKGRRV